MPKDSGYEFYLGRLLLPVAPKKLDMTINNANTTITLIDEGQVNLLKTPELTDIEFECMLPQLKYPFAVYRNGFKRAAYFLEKFEKLKTKKKPFQFIVSRSLPTGDFLYATNLKVSLEDYKITEQASDGFDPTVKISLKQYREIEEKTVSIKKKSESGSTKTKAKETKKRPSDSKPESKKHKVGDIVNFHGGTHYYSSYKGAKGYSTKAGKAKITLGPDCEGNGGAHPWHLIHTDSGSNVYGWVDEGTFD